MLADIIYTSKANQWTKKKFFVDVNGNNLMAIFNHDDDDDDVSCMDEWKWTFEIMIVVVVCPLAFSFI